MTAAASASRARAKHGWTPAAIVTALSIGYLAWVVLLWCLLFLVSEQWWLSSILTFLPRAPWLAPAVGLVTASLLWNPKALGWNLLSILLLVVPIMELRLTWRAATPPTALRVVTANVEMYQARDHTRLLAEIESLKPDVVVLQESPAPPAAWIEAFAGWQTLHRDYYFVASRYPVQWLADCPSPMFERQAGLVAEVQTPRGAIALANVHLMTFRKAARWSPVGLAKGVMADEVTTHNALRRLEADDVRAAMEAVRGPRPLIVCGDFNAPSSSHLFWNVWGDLRNAFDDAGCGFGYTAPCKQQGPWPEGLPWARIDHVLASYDCSFVKCNVGLGRGSDHRLMVADVMLPNSNGAAQPVAAGAGRPLIE